MVLPCLNEADTVSRCVREARRALAKARISGEVIVADNGSTDASAKRARAAGARVVNVSPRGYGAALKGGIAAAGGEWILMADADASYDFSSLPEFAAKLREGFDLAQGTRLRGTILKGAMPWSHRWLGTPFFNLLLRILFGLRVSDSQCGMRAFTRRAFNSLKMRSDGMEFASEMLVKAVRRRLELAEVPIRYRPDARTRPPHLRAFYDGWRHLRLMLLLSPASMLLGPGILLSAAGLASIGAALGRLHVSGYQVGFHFAILGSGLVLIGYQVASLGLAMSLLRGNRQPAWSRAFLRIFTLEKTLAIGIALGLAGFALGIRVLVYWLGGDFESFSTSMTMQGIIGTAMILLGAEVVFGGFFMAVLLSAEPDKGRFP